MGLRKLLAMLLIMSMLVSFIPAAVFATDAEEGTGNTGAETGTVKLDNLFLDKKAVLKDDGTYTIDLGAYATGTTINKTITEGVPLDVVLVLDQSGSLHYYGSLDTLKSSVNSFLEDLKENGEQFGVNHRVAICGFASYGKQGTTGLASAGYTYANDNRDNVWTNTGIFVDGEFLDYGTVEYTKINSYTEISTSGAYAIAVKFSGQEKAEIVNVMYSSSSQKWCTVSEAQYVNLFDSVSKANAAQYLFEKTGGYVYEIGDSVNQLTDADYEASWENIASGSDGQGDINPYITEAVNHLSSNGTTATFMGMKMARKMLENAPEDEAQRKKVVIVFTDGMPGTSGYAQGDADAALAEAMRIKETGTEIYTIGIYGSEVAVQADQFMNQLSSNYASHSFSTSPFQLTQEMIALPSDSATGYSSAGNMRYYRNLDLTVTGISPYFTKDTDGNYWPISVEKVQSTYNYSYLSDDGESSTDGDSVYQLTEHVANSEPNADYYKYASSIEELSSIFETISSDVTSYTSQLSLDADAILKDVLADGFKLTDKTTVTVSVVPGSVSEKNSNIPANELTADKITWDEAQQVLSFAYPAKTSADGTVTVNGAADQTQMTIAATATADGEITVTGFNYAKPEDADNINAQYISYGHPGSKLVVTITGVEAESDITTDSVIATNQTTSGIYEGLESDADGDENKGEIQATFPVPTTYLSSKTYYVDYSGELVIDPADFRMTIEGISADIDGYNYINTPGTTLELEHGTVTVGEDGEWVFTMDPGDWSITDTFYLFGKTGDETVKAATANADGYMWSKITIVTPADVSGKLFLDKEATLTDDGTYTIDLDAFATGTPVSTIIKEGIPLDVVLVIDQSGSLYKYGYLETLKKSVGGFMEALYVNGEANGVDHRVSICGFASNATRGPGGLEATGYTYACKEKDLAWTNTGIFVNGEFQKCGTFDYTPIYDPEDVDRNRMYGLMWDSNEDGTPEMAVARIRNNEWQVWDSKLGYKTVGKDIKDADGVVIQTREENMMENHHVIYDLREITNTLTDADFAAAWEHLANEANGQGGINKDITTTVENLCSNGSTYTMYGLKLAQQMMKKAPDDGIQRKKVVVVFTDGEPGQNGYNKGDADGALSEAKRIKDQGIEIYGIGMYSTASANQENFMNRMSSNYEGLDYEAVAALNPNGGNGVQYGLGLDMMYYAYTPYFYKNEAGEYWPIVLEYENGKSNYIYASYVADEGYVPIAEGEKTEIATKVGQVYTLTQGVPSTNPEADYYKYAKNTSELAGIFAEFAESMTTEKRQSIVDADAILKDVMADGFKLTDNTTITVSVVPGSVGEAYQDVAAADLTEDMIVWNESQEVLSFAYPAKTSADGKVTVNGAADRTEMTIAANATADGEITVTGFNYANPTDNYKKNAQYICAGHPGSKLVVTITGVEAKSDIVTDSVTTTNKGTSGIYESEDSDLDGDGETGEIQASFPVPTTYLSSKTYYVDYSGELVIDPADFRMTIEGISADIDGYNYFNTPGTTLELEHGTVTVGEDGEWVFTMDPGDWSITDSFFLFGKTGDETVKTATANADGYMWSKITIVTPADVSGKLFLDKEATLTDDGTYTIDLNAYATGTPAITSITEGVPLDVVLVIDQSGSLQSGSWGASLDDLKASAEGFINSLYANGEANGVDHRVSVCGFAAAAYNGYSTSVEGYTMAGAERDCGWVNTGLFVNGEFRKYGKLDYTEITDPNKLDTNKQYAVEWDLDGDGQLELALASYSSGVWKVAGYGRKDTIGRKTVNDNGEEVQSAGENMLANYTVYDIGASHNQLNDTMYEDSWEHIAAGANGTGGVNPTVSKIISNFSANGGTATIYGLKMARKMLENAPDDGIERKQIVIVFTDGTPGRSGYTQSDANAALSEAKKLKEAGIEIYGIGLFKNAAPEWLTFMEYMSSNYVKHGFETESTMMDVTKALPSSNAFWKIGLDFNQTAAGTSPYFYKDANGDYWPIYLSYTNFNPSNGKDTATSVYNVSYIADDGEYSIASGKKDEISDLVGPVYMMTAPELNVDANQQYFKHADSVEVLSAMFAEVAKEMTTYTREAHLDATAIMKDVMADGFTLTDKTTVTVSVVPGSVSEAYKDVAAADLTEDMIVWNDPQEVLSFVYPAKTSGTGTVTVNGAADQTQMTITATATADGEITVTGFNYANPTDAYRENAQYINAGHPGSKLVVTITGVEAKTDVVTDSITTTNKGTSGIYESEDSDLDGDGETGEILASFPIPTTYLTSEYYYLDENNSVTFDPKDFLMTVEGINADPDGYNFFDINTPGTTIETQYGTVTVNTDGTITYTLKEGSVIESDIFYLFGTTNDPTVTGASANEDGNMWSKITILPPLDASGKLQVDKNATLESNGTYTIDLEAFATGTPVSTIIQEGVPLDVVLVLDQSGSMVKGDFGTSVEVFKQSVSSFIDALNANGMSFGVNHRVAICGFGNDGTNCVSGLVKQGYGYAGEAQESAWCNTGLFVNGQFINYGTMEYLPVSDINEIKTSPYYLHSIDYDADGDGKMERVALRYTGGKWVTGRLDAYTVAEPTTAEDGTTISATKNLFANYTVYINGEVSNQLTDKDYANAWGNLAAGENGSGGLNPDVAKVIGSLTGNGCTYTFYGMKMAAKMLENCPDDGIERKKIVILFTDGQPGYSGYVDGDGESALAESDRIKGMGAEIYAIGLYKSTGTKAERFMNQLSSNSGIHSFQSEPVRIDVSKGGASATNTFAKFAPQIDGTWGGFTPYFYKVDNGDGTSNYYPITMYAPTDSCASFKVYYNTDEGRVLITNCARADVAEKVGDVYRLDLNSVNTDLNAGYYKQADKLELLEYQFKNISEKMTTYTSETYLDATAILKDVMADGFVLTDKTTITVSVVPGSVKEEYAELTADELTADHIAWGNPQQVLSFAYPAKTSGTGKVTVNGAADKTQMSITAKATADGVITVTGFNYAAPTDNHKENAQYICVGHPGSKLVVTITGVEAKADVVTDSVIVTNKGTSGIYEGPNSDMDGDGVKGEIQSSFPIPTTYMASKVYVVDYAKTLTADPADFQMDIGAISVDVDGYNHFDPATTAVTDAYGKVTVSDGKVTYTPGKTNWDGFDTFHIFGTTNDETVKAATANGDGNMWAKISVIPANNVYYEDTFVTSEDTGIAGIVYGGVWDEVDKDGNANAGGNGQIENAESDEGNQGGVHGWEDTLADDTGFSDGSAHVSTTPGATATFTFTGTGVDIYSRTNMETGIVMAMLYEGTSTTDKDGKNLVAKYGLMVDNLAASGDYYQIPTLSLCQIPAKDENGKTIVDENGDTVMKDLPYGTYTVMLIVSKASASQTGDERFTYYLDGIRVYNPIQELEDDSTVSGAYGDKEINANFVEIRDELLDANSFTAENEEAAGPVFIDRITGEDGEHTNNTVTLEVGEYKVFGPENEVYLSAGQAVAFAVDYKEGAHYYIGMKSLTGNTAGAVVSNDDGETTVSVGHTTDMYYEVYPVWEDEDGTPYTDAQGNPIGIISIMADDQNGQSLKDANGNDIYEGAILALTKLKVTGPKAKNFRFAKVPKSTLVESAQKTANNLPDVDAGDSDTQKPQLGKVEKWNIALQEDFEVKFYLQISEDIEDSAKVSLTIGNGNVTYDVSSLEKTEDGYYLLKARLAATQMSDKISVQIIHGEDKGEIFTYTVREYCDTILSKDEYSAYHALVKEMLNYGAMAQMYFNYDIQNLANAGITGAAAVAVPETAKDMAVADKLSGVDFYGASLVYRDKIAVRYYFIGDMTGLTFTANGKTYKPVEKDGMHYVEIADILPQDVDQQITLTAMDADGDTLSVIYGPMNYIVRMNAKGSETLKNLMKALYNYHLAAKAWSEQ